MPAGSSLKPPLSREFPPRLKLCNPRRSEHYRAAPQGPHRPPGRRPKYRRRLVHPALGSGRFQRAGPPCTQEGPGVGGPAGWSSPSLQAKAPFALRAAAAQPRGLPKAARASRGSPPQRGTRMAADVDPPGAQHENSPPERENGRPEKERGNARNTGICCRRRIQGAPEVRHSLRPIYSVESPVPASSRFASHKDGA